MERLWAPWRMEYVGSPGPTECIFCMAAQGRKDYVLSVSEGGVIMLNVFPYTSGHLMVAPLRHVPDLESLTPQEAASLMWAVRQCEVALKREYKPQGFNIGINLGTCAGAGVPGHVHVHVVPRWAGDTNFMPVVGQVRVIPEALDRTFERLKPHFGAP